MTRTTLQLNQQSIQVDHDRDIDGPAIVTALRSAQTAMTQTVVNTSKVYGFCATPGYLASLNAEYLDLLRLSFNLPAPDSAGAGNVYLQALRRILDTIALIRDAMTADTVEITEQEAAVEEEHRTAHGYVAKTFGEGVSAAFRSYGHDLSKVKPLVNPVHLKLADKSPMLAWYWIHEVSHKHALTVDAANGGQTAYFDAINRADERTRFRATCQAMRDAGSPKTVEEMMADDVFTKKMRAFTPLQLLDNADSYSHYIMCQPEKVC